MPDLKDAARQALEALEELNGWQSLAPPLASQAGRQAAINLRAALEQPEQAPAAWIQPDHLQKAKQAPFLCRVEPTQRCADFVPFFTHPPRREWRGLTYQEIDDLQSGMQATFKDICAIEAALKEKNHE